MLWKYKFLVILIGQHKIFILTVLNDYSFYMVRCIDKFFKSVLFGLEIKQHLVLESFLFERDYAAPYGCDYRSSLN